MPFGTAAPFPLKLATWLRMAEVPFEIVVANDASKGPKGKSPWIEWEGVRMGDSSLIIEHVAARLDIDLDAHLDARQRALAVAVQRMLEEHYHQCFEHQLFFGEGADARIRAFQEMMPFPINLLLPPLLRRAFRTQLYARGMGRHDPSVIIAQGKADLDALAELLGDQPYVLGDRPCSLDACVFGFLGVSVYVDGTNPLFRHAASHPNLMRYCERMRARYFPETLQTLPPLFDSAPSPAEGVA
ncbi:MAG: glutathione S-transferase family protein [Alphaproteobacteria bacterium]|nr:glutathione S-transferase family protein [Alphaproteobacteria bacterium]